MHVSLEDRVQEPRILRDQGCRLYVRCTSRPCIAWQWAELSWGSTSGWFQRSLYGGYWLSEPDSGSQQLNSDSEPDEIILIFGFDLALTNQTGTWCSSNNHTQDQSTMIWLLNWNTAASCFWTKMVENGQIQETAALVIHTYINTYLWTNSAVPSHRDAWSFTHADDSNEVVKADTLKKPSVDHINRKAIAGQPWIRLLICAFTKHSISHLAFGLCTKNFQLLWDSCPEKLWALKCYQTAGLGCASTHHFWNANLPDTSIPVWIKRARTCPLRTCKLQAINELKHMKINI